MIQIVEKTTIPSEQRLLLPGNFTWQDLERLQQAFIDTTGLRITYLDECVEIMTIGKEHEYVRALLEFLLQLYFCEQGIEYEPTGSATRRSERKNVSFEPDLSYTIRSQGKDVELAIEVVITSGSTNKLEKYKRFNLAEVWFWEDDRISIFHLEKEGYQPCDRSKLFPDLDPASLVRCVRMPSRIEARNTFLQSLQGS